MEQSENLEFLNNRKIPPFTLFKRVFSYFKKETWKIVLATILMLTNVLVELLYPQIIQAEIDTLDHVSNGTQTTFLVILGLALGYFGIAVVGQICIYFESRILLKSGQRIVFNLRYQVFEHIESLSQNQLNQMSVGSLVTRVANYTSSMSDLFTNDLVNLIKNIITVIGSFTIMMIKSWKLTLILSGIVVLVFVISLVFRKIIVTQFRKEKNYISDLNTFLNENLSGMKITQTFNQESRKLSEFDEKNELIRKTRFKVVIAFAIYRPTITFIYYAAIALTFVNGMKLNLRPGEIVAFYLYLSRFFNPIQAIADQINHLQRALTSSEKLFNLLDVKPEVVDLEDAVDVESFEGRIEFKNVWFAYKENEWILKDVSFVIEPKQTVAFLGATGAGKTTILSLIVRNYEIQKGQILIDGRDITKIKIKSLRKAIGQMLQDVFLFTGTIRNNITLNDENYSDEEIMDVCRYVNADSFINKTEKGLDEQVKGRGENYSQGQRQLISFARTVLAKPQILILDEATANIDTETEKLIQESLDKIKNIGTMLVVAHRLSTIQNADQIIVLNKGEVVERGNHQSLLKLKGYYYRLYQLQFSDKL